MMSAAPKIATGPPATGTGYEDYLLAIRNEEEIEIHGRLLGLATSAREDHTHAVLTTDNQVRYVDSGERCSACRWFEVRIFAVKHAYVDHCTCDDVPASAPTDISTYSGEHHEQCGVVLARGQYLVLTYGITTVPNESHKRRAVWTNSPYEIIEILTQRNASGSFLPATSARVIAQAAACDRGIRDAYVNRAVT